MVYNSLRDLWNLLRNNKSILTLLEYCHFSYLQPGFATSVLSSSDYLYDVLKCMISLFAEITF